MRLLGLLAVLAGLFGMHGLACHGLEDMDVLPGTVLAATMTSETGTGPSLTDPARHVSTTPEVSQSPVVVSDSGPGPMDMGKGMGKGMGMAVMCVALLATATLVLLRYARRGRTAPVLWSRPRETPMVFPAGCGPGAPSLTELSIQRC